ncbi:MAG: hypothetical protein EXS36_09045 [Pedosphaera sp.]|nr:hypothetical protein [Pedosphaera sp.]
MFIAAWARITELELGRDDLIAAKSSLLSLKQLAPDHALTRMLEGFAELTGNRPTAAVERFQASLARDPSLADAWFGLGLGRIRQGHPTEGLSALETPVALEPERSLFRSYLAKALALNRRDANASVQITEAKTLDSGDPTPWLYSAWFDYGKNRINPAITNLQRSIERNDNLQLFRSRAQLDQDRAMSVTSLARMYERRACLRSHSVRPLALWPMIIQILPHIYSSRTVLMRFAIQRVSIFAMKQPGSMNFYSRTRWYWSTPAFSRRHCLGRRIPVCLREVS